MRIAVLGGGNGCYAAAADLAEQGHKVRFWRRDAAAFAETLKAQGIELKDYKGQRFIKLDKATTEIGEALEGAELVVIPTPAFAQEEIAHRMAPHMRTGMVVYLPPGTFGTYVMAKIVRQSGNPADVAWAENGTLPWLCRKHGSNLIAISVRAAQLPTGVFPLRLADHAHKVLKAAFPSVVPCGDGLSGAMMNAGPIIHPPLITMNAGPIEHFERWDIHNEGTQKSIRRVTDALDEERVRLRETMGYGERHWRLKEHYDKNSDGWMYGRNSHERLVESKDWHEHLVLTEHRYMLEDVGMGLALLSSVGRYAGVPTPLVDAFLSIGSAVTGQNFRRDSRTLETLGLAHLSRAELAAVLQEGLR